jgi:hypothetical protein
MPSTPPAGSTTTRRRKETTGVLFEGRPNDESSLSIDAASDAGGGAEVAGGGGGVGSTHRPSLTVQWSKVIHGRCNSVSSELQKSSWSVHTVRGSTVTGDTGGGSGVVCGRRGQVVCVYRQRCLSGMVCAYTRPWVGMCVQAKTFERNGVRVHATMGRYVCTGKDV